MQRYGFIFLVRTKITLAWYLLRSLRHAFTSSSLCRMNMINVNKVFSGHRPCQFVKDHQRFRDHLCPHHQGNETLVVFNEVTRLMAREDFVNVSRRESITSHMVSAAYRSVPVFCLVFWNYSWYVMLFVCCYVLQDGIEWEETGCQSLVTCAS
jgi:hypothetical protein